MAYASQNDIQMAAGGAARFVQLFDWNNDLVADADVIAQAQRMADAWLDGYLRIHYQTPIANPSPTIVRLAADEAVRWARMSTGMPDEQAAAAEARKAAAEEIKDIVARKLLPDDPAPPPSTVAQRPAIVQSDSPVSRCGLKGMW